MVELLDASDLAHNRSKVGSPIVSWHIRILFIPANDLCYVALMNDSVMESLKPTITRQQRYYIARYSKILHYGLTLVHLPASLCYFCFGRCNYRHSQLNAGLLDHTLQDSDAANSRQYWTLYQCPWLHL